MIHIGHCIFQKLQEKGKTTVWLSQQIGCHRTNVYKLYDKMSIDTNILMRISKILGYDFFSLYSNELQATGPTESQM